MTKFRYFGTDGIRGVVGEPPITADFILKLGWALGKVMRKSDNDASVVVGKDTRISGYMFESALQAGLVASGTDILLSGPISTPAVAYLTQTFNACAGIVISASHNSYLDNGIKLFGEDGQKISDAVQKKIESYIDKPLQTVPAVQLGRASRIPDAGGRYIEFCKSTLSKHISLKGYRVVVDCAHGATYSTAPGVFEELGAEVIRIGVEPDGFNINDSCGSTYPQKAAEAVKKFRADFGVVLDGDGDRLVMIDHQGELLDGDDLLYILAHHWHASGQLEGGVVGTDMTNMGLEQFFHQKGIDFQRVPVGDRHIIAALEDNSWLLGGETSGHILCPRYSTAGDGIISALQIITILVEQNTKLHHIKQGYTRYIQRLINIDCANDQVVKKKEVQAVIRCYQKKISNEGRIFVRKSGTESKLRILIESADEQLVNRMSEQLVPDMRLAMD